MSGFLSGHRRSLSGIALFLGVGAMLAIVPAHARTETDTEPRAEMEVPLFRYGISGKAIWNSNPVMLRNNPEDIYGTETRAFFGFQKKTETSKLELDLTALRNQFDQSQYNSTDGYAKAVLEKIFQRWRLGFTGSYDHDTTRSSEITTFGQDVGTGRRKAYTLQPSALYMITERSALGITGRWQESRYESGRLTDYRIASLVPSYLYHLSPLQAMTLSLQAQRYALLDNTDQHIDSIGPTIAWKYNFHPNWTLDLSGGSLASKISGYGGAGGDWDNNLVYGATLNYRNQKNDASISANRSRQPYANGTESLLTTLEIRERYTANEKLDLEVKANYQFAKQPPTSTNDLDRAWGGSATLNYKLNPNWAVDLSYKYREEELTNNSKAAEQQIVHLGLSYKFGYNR